MDEECAQPPVAVLLLGTGHEVVRHVTDQPLQWAKTMHPDTKYFDSFPLDLVDFGRIPPDVDGNVIVWVDDMGEIKQLRRNHLAARKLLVGFYGPVLVTGAADEHGNLRGLDDRVVEYFKTP